MTVIFRRKLARAFSSVLAVQLVFLSIAPASAGLFSGPKMPSTSSMFSDMEDRYHLDSESIRTQAESFNVGDNKKLVPEVSLFFSPSDPRPGEKISAKAFPAYFSNDAKNLYYTWYLKRKGCDLNKNPNEATKKLCDADGDNRITIEDWKIVAMRLLAQHNYEAEAGTYDNAPAPDKDDNDGYQARYGGDNKVSSPDHCYVNDSISGKSYELISTNADETTFTDCTGPNEEAVCVEGELLIDSGTITTDPVAPTSSEAFSFVEGTICRPSGFPVCSGSGTVSCAVGAPRCVVRGENTSCGTEILSCNKSDTDPGDDRACKHLFPDAPNFTTGDGKFTYLEEAFWGTNPTDPDTAENGNKDEANIVGLGRTELIWNYAAGDKLGVAVEGNATTNTKYADSSYMIMWAFPKKDCPISLASSLGTMTKKIKKYDVVIPTAKMDLNKCIGYLKEQDDGSFKEYAPNLVDPTEGGQATSLEVDISASPDNPINDESVDEAGDVVSVQASISNGSHDMNNMSFEWEVDISDTPQFSTPPNRITGKLQELGLLGNVKGIALDTLRLRLNIPNKADKLIYDNKPLGEYLNDSNVGYLQFSAKVTESFASDSVRKGKSSVIVKFTSSGDKILVHKVTAVPSADGSMRVALQPAPDGTICKGDPTNPDNDKDKLDRTSCRVIKNEILGLSVERTGRKNFNWTINGKQLLCKEEIVSSDCRFTDEDPTDPTRTVTLKEQGPVNFFPVSGDVGDTYTVTVTANDIKTDKTVTLTRSFHVVEPTLSIESINNNAAWPKLLGAYRDVSTTTPAKECPGGLCLNYSNTIFEAFAGESLSFKAVFMPNFLANRAVRQWAVDGTPLVESGNVTGGAIAFSALKNAGDIYNITLQASLVQSQEIRQALRDIWGISPLDSPEITFSKNAQVELQEPGFAQGNLQGTKKYLAAIASYIPTSVIFLLRVVLSIFLLIFTANVLYALLPERVAFPRGYLRKE